MSEKRMNVGVRLSSAFFESFESCRLKQNLTKQEFLEQALRAEVNNEDVRVEMQKLQVAHTSILNRLTYSEALLRGYERQGIFGRLFSLRPRLISCKKGNEVSQEV